MQPGGEGKLELETLIWELWMQVAVSFDDLSK